MKQKYKSILILVTLISLLGLYIENSEFIIQNFLDYSLLFLKKLFPVSFIFYLFSALLLEYGIIELIEKITKKNSSRLYLLLISMISGFPSGAKYTLDLYLKKYISLEEANNYLLFSHFPNPLFVMSTVYSVMNDSITTYKILLAIILSNILIYFIFRKGLKTNNYKRQSINNNFSKILSQSISSSFSTLSIIYGTSVFFFLIICIITKYIHTSVTIYVLLNGFFDLTKGVLVTSIITNSNIRAYLILFFISFGGISIHMQVKSILQDSPIKYIYFLKGRVWGTLLAGIIFYLFTFF